MNSFRLPVERDTEENGEDRRDSTAGHRIRQTGTPICEEDVSGGAAARNDPLILLIL